MSKPSFFTGYTTDPDSLDDWANSLTIETSEGVLKDADHTPIPLVQIDTNYKPGRTGTHPVRLTVRDTLKAAAALIDQAHKSLDGFVDLLDKSVGDDELLWLLDELSVLDSNVWELRGFLQNEIQHRRSRDDGDEAEADEAEQPATTNTEPQKEDGQ